MLYINLLCWLQKYITMIKLTRVFHNTDIILRNHILINIMNIARYLPGHSHVHCTYPIWGSHNTGFSVAQGPFQPGPCSSAEEPSPGCQVSAAGPGLNRYCTVEFAKSSLFLLGILNINSWRTSSTECVSGHDWEKKLTSVTVSWRWFLCVCRCPVWGAVSASRRACLMNCGKKHSERTSVWAQSQSFLLGTEGQPAAPGSQRQHRVCTQGRFRRRLKAISWHLKLVLHIIFIPQVLQ